MDIIDFTSPFTGADIKAVELDDRTLLIDTPIGEKALCTLEYVPQRKCYLLPENIVRHIDTMSASEAAECLGYDKMRISRMCDSGQLKSVKTLGRLVIERASVLEWREEHGGDGRSMAAGNPE